VVYYNAITKVFFTIKTSRCFTAGAQHVIQFTLADTDLYKTISSAFHEKRS
jgi:hypothetical protein